MGSESGTPLNCANKNVQKAKSKLRLRTCGIKLVKTFDDLGQELILRSQVSNTLGTGQKCSQQRTTKPNPAYIRLWELSVSELMRMIHCAYPCPLGIREPMTKRMEERHESTHESYKSDCFVESLCIQQRTFNERLQSLKVPFRVFLRVHDLRLHHSCVENPIIHLHAHFEFDLLYLPLTSSHRILHRVGTREIWSSKWYPLN